MRMIIILSLGWEAILKAVKRSILNVLFDNLIKKN